MVEWVWRVWPPFDTKICTAENALRIENYSTKIWKIFADRLTDIAAFIPMVLLLTPGIQFSAQSEGLSTLIIGFFAGIGNYNFE